MGDQTRVFSGESSETLYLEMCMCVKGQSVSQGC